MGNDAYFMNLAMNLALRAQGKTFPNPLVGAVVVKNSKIIGKGYHHRAGLPHAEILALRQAGEKSRGAKLYVTLEPCSHFGCTPPCVDAVIKSGVKEVVVGMIDPNPLNHGKSINKLRKNKIKVKIGFWQEELKQINAPFIKYITQKIPFVTIKVGQSLDGKIATPSGESKWITAKKTRDFTHNLRKLYDAILVGINTVLKDNPSLHCKVKAIKKIIVDSDLRLPLNARLFSKTPAENIIVAAALGASRQKIQRLRKKGIMVLTLPGRQGKVSLRRLMKELARREITNILVEGGGEINASFLKEKLADKVCFFIAPKIIGGRDSINSFGGEGIKSITQAIDLGKVKVRNIGRDLWVEGDIVYRDN